ncbi:hypothetical protein BDW60DRAFT_214685 [Aspergillus nidulans var. acristatus]
MSSQPEINLLKTAYIFPSQTSTRTTVSLSILDTVVTTMYAACAAAIAITLSSFLHFAGTLNKITNDSDPANYGHGDAGNIKRYGRLHITFGTVQDPGVEFSTAHCGATLDEIKLPFIGGSCSSSPVLIQVTQFRCGGVAIAGDIDALPSSRYDWFYPASDGNSDRNQPSGITRSMIKSPWNPMPKEDWDTALPVSLIKLHFSVQQTKKIWEVASGLDLGVSRYDAIVAHVWSAINRARVQMPGKDAANASPSTSQRHDIATKIRSSISLYYPDNLKARLHDLCFEVTSQRLWEAYLGRRHVIFTSWAHLSLYEVDFGGSRGRPRFVEPYMPVLDGLLCLMDGRPGQKDKEGNRNWCDDGVDVAVSDTEMSFSFATEAMERSRDDPELWV